MNDAGAREAVRLDLLEERLWVEGRPIELARKPFALLRFFALNPGRLLTKAEIAAHLWPTTHVSDSLIKGYVRDLRRALKDDPQCPGFIETLRGRGYRYLGELAWSSVAAPGRPQS